MDQLSELISTAKPYGDLISAAGALIIFFSWLAKNTLYERYNTASNAHSTSESLIFQIANFSQLHNAIYYRTSNILGEIRILKAILGYDDLNNKDRFISLHTLFLQTSDEEYRIESTMESIKAIEILSSNLKEDTDAKHDFIKVKDEISAIVSRLNTIKDIAVVELNKGDDAIYEVVEEYASQWNRELSPKITGVMHKLIKVAEKISSENKIKLNAIRRKRKIYDTISFYLYSAGTILVLLGQAFSKIGAT